MQGGLPDPEMRRFLAAGTVDGVRSALHPHFSKGLELVKLDDKEFTVAFNGRELTRDTKQKLKHTVRDVNELMGE